MLRFIASKVQTPWATADLLGNFGIACKFMYVNAVLSCYYTLQAYYNVGDKQCLIRLICTCPDYLTGCKRLNVHMLRLVCINKKNNTPIAWVLICLFINFVHVKYFRLFCLLSWNLGKIWTLDFKKSQPLKLLMYLRKNALEFFMPLTKHRINLTNTLWFMGRRGAGEIDRKSHYYELLRQVISNSWR